MAKGDEVVSECRCIRGQGYLELCKSCLDKAREESKEFGRQLRARMKRIQQIDEVSSLRAQLQAAEAKLKTIRRETIEECAVVCDATSILGPEETSHTAFAMSEAAKVCAANVRALADKDEK